MQYRYQNRYLLFQRAILQPLQDIDFLQSCERCSFYLLLLSFYLIQSPAFLYAIALAELTCN